MDTALDESLLPLGALKKRFEIKRLLGAEYRENISVDDADIAILGKKINFIGIKISGNLWKPFIVPLDTSVIDISMYGYVDKIILQHGHKELLLSSWGAQVGLIDIADALSVSIPSSTVSSIGRIRIKRDKEYRIESVDTVANNIEYDFDNLKPIGYVNLRESSVSTSSNNNYYSFFGGDKTFTVYSDVEEVIVLTDTDVILIKDCKLYECGITDSSTKIVDYSEQCEKAIKVYGDKMGVTKEIPKGSDKYNYIVRRLIANEQYNKDGIIEWYD